VAEQSMLDLMPLRDAGQIMPNLSNQVGFGSKLLKFDFEQPHA
jgi:hypothetical protein